MDEIFREGERNAEIAQKGLARIIENWKKVVNPIWYDPAELEEEQTFEDEWNFWE